MHEVGRKDQFTFCWLSSESYFKGSPDLCIFLGAIISLDTLGKVSRLPKHEVAIIESQRLQRRGRGQELDEKFLLPSVVMDSVLFNRKRKAGDGKLRLGGTAVFDGLGRPSVARSHLGGRQSYGAAATAACSTASPSEIRRLIIPIDGM